MIETRPARSTSIRNCRTIIWCSHCSIELVAAPDQVCQAEHYSDACCGEDIYIALPAVLLRRGHVVLLSRYKMTIART